MCQGKPLACIYYKDCSTDYVAIESLVRQLLIIFFKEKSPKGNQGRENREIQLDQSRKINL